ncbi:MAG: hypothetical protein IJZ89_02915 [Clostridia bacterium]|nr:hypothetical protein [Clostridia bacterium]
MKFANENDKIEIIKCCAFCEKATPLAGDEYVLCSKKGVVALTYKCRRFAYDPLKRIPKRAPSLMRLEELSDELPDV